jgi:D-alanine-D-alanine ligase
MIKHVIKNLGILTPDFFVVNTLADLARIDLRFPLFAKPAAGGTSQGIDIHSHVRDKAELSRTCERLLDRFRQPVLVEEYLPGREVTIGIIGTGEKAQALGTMEIILNGKAEGVGYSYHNKVNYKELVEYNLIQDELAQQAEQTALAVWRSIGARDAGRVDLRCDAQGRVHFIEVNPLAGLNPLDSDLPILCSKIKLSYHDLIRRIVESAQERTTASPQAKNPFASSSSLSKKKAN